MENSFIKARNIRYDEFAFRFQTTQKLSLKIGYGILLEKGIKWTLGNEEATLIHDTFIPNKLNYETQKNLLKKRISSTKNLELIIYIPYL